MSQPAPRENVATRLNRAKNQTLLVGGVGAIVALAFFLASLFTGSGVPGLGTDTQKDDTKQPVADTQNEQTPPEVKPQPLSPDNQVSTVAADDPGDVLFLKVVQNGYQVRRTVNKTSTYEPATLPDIVALARKADGDDKGIKVILEVAWDATSQHEADLQKSLTAPVANGGAGLDGNAIMKKKDF